MKSAPVVLICPLDWGLGHATRCVPVIRFFLDRGCRVHLAGHGNSLALLVREFPELESHRLDGFSVKYGKGKALWLKLAVQLPSFFVWMWLEHQRLKNIVRQINPALIVSDNRYGLYHKKVRSVIVTHQLNPQGPRAIAFLSLFVQKVIHHWVGKFNECWIPDEDFGQAHLSGQLSQPSVAYHNVLFVGHLSRFNNTVIHADNLPVGNGSITQTGSGQIHLWNPSIEIPSEPFVLGIVSGPESQRTVFCDLLEAQFAALAMPCVLVAGLPLAHRKVAEKGNIQIVPYACSHELEVLLERCEMVVCRAGYSSVMDLWALKKRAILVPTPGQTEQLYLGRFLMDERLFYSVGQDVLCLPVDLPKAVRFYGDRCIDV